MSAPSLSRKASTTSLTSTQAPLTRHQSRSSLGGHSAGSSYLTASPNVRVRQRSATRFEALKKDLIVSRLAKCRGLSQIPQVGIDPDVVIDVLVPTLPDQSELKFADIANDAMRLVVITPTTFATFNGVRTHAPRPGEPITDGVQYTPAVLLRVDDISALYDSAVDDRCLYVHTVVPARMSQRDMEARLFEFESAALRDRFVAHALALLNPTLVNAAAEHAQLPADGVQLASWDAALRTGDDVRRNLRASASKHVKDAADDGDEEESKPTALETTELDLAHVATERVQLCAKIAAFGDSRVLFSSEASVKDNTHDIVILCDQALYMGKARKEHKLRTRIPYEAIEAAVSDTLKPQVVVKLDFTKVTLKGDLMLTFPSVRNRDLFVNVISSAFESCVVDRLPITSEEDVFWSKRGLVESQLLRVYGAVKTNRFTKAISALGSAEQLPEGHLAPETARACKRLLYAMRTDPRHFVASFTGCGASEAETEFIARCVYSVFDQAGWTEVLLRACVQATVLGAPSTTSTSGAIPLLLFQEPASLAASVVRHYTGQCGDQYVQVVFSQTMDAFATNNESFKTMHLAADVDHWVERFLKPLLQNTDGALFADEIKLVIALLHETPGTAVAAEGASAARATTGINPSSAELSLAYIGQFFFAKLVYPALMTPVAQGLLLVDLEPAQVQNLERIVAVLRVVFTGDESYITGPNSPLVDLSSRDLQELGSYARAQNAKVRELLKGFIFSDLLSDGHLAKGEGEAAAIVPFPGKQADTAGLGAYIDTHVILSDHNPKLLTALNKALAPYAAAMFGAYTHLAGVGSGADAGSARSRAASQTGGDHSGPGVTNASMTGTSAQAATTAKIVSNLENTVQQLTHEVLDLRRQLAEARDEAHRVKVQAARMQEHFASLPSAAKRRGVSFATSTKAGGAQASSSSSSGDTSSDGSEESEGGDARSPHLRSIGRGSPKHRVNPLASQPSALAQRPRNGLSPASQDYRRAYVERHGTRPNAVPVDSVVFGCPLDTYVLGGRPLLPDDSAPDPNDDPDL
jgi:hypothetical protein